MLDLVEHAHERVRLPRAGLSAQQHMGIDYLVQIPKHRHLLLFLRQKTVVKAQGYFHARILALPWFRPVRAATESAAAAANASILNDLSIS